MVGAPDRARGEVVATLVGSKMGAGSGFWGQFVYQNWVFQASWHLQSTYDASLQFASLRCGSFWRPQEG